MVPVRPIGIFAILYSTVDGARPSSICVLITAGEIALTVMSPLPASSLASDFVNAMTAALDAESGKSVGLPSLPAIEATAAPIPCPARSRAIWPVKSKNPAMGMHQNRQRAKKLGPCTTW